jgi:putative ABC transport system permease protein
VASWTLPVLYAESTVLPRSAQPAVSAPETLMAIGAAALLALLFAGIPAFLLTRRDPLSLMRGDFAHSGARFARSSLVATQVALGVIVLVGAGLLIRSFVRVITVPLGFNAEGLTVAELRMPPGGPGEQAPAVLQKAQTFLTTELGTQPFALGRMPFAGATYTRNWTLGAKPFDFDQSFGTESRLVTASYFETLGISVQSGRGFDAADTSASLPVAVVSAAFARRHGRQHNVVGNLLRTDRREYHIVGIVDDVRASRLAIAPSPTVYTLLEQQPSTNFAIAVRSSNVRAVGNVVGQLAAALGPDVVVTHVTAVTARIARSEARRRFFVLLLSALAVLAATLSAIGIVGVMATTVAARRRELAIRLAIGGTPGRVKLAVARAGLVPVVVGVAGGTLAAWMLARWAAASDAIQSQLYQTSARDPLTLTLSAALLLVVGAVACWLPARQAAAIHPMVILKSD